MLDNSVRRMDHEQKNDKAKRARGLGRKTREKTGKEESNDSSEIPDKGETSDIPVNISKKKINKKKERKKGLPTPFFRQNNDDCNYMKISEVPLRTDHLLFSCIELVITGTPLQYSLPFSLF